MPNLAITSGLMTAAVTIGVSTAIDIAIDRSGHDRESWTYQRVNRFLRAAKHAGIGLLAASLGASLLPSTRGAAKPLVQIDAGAVGAWAVTN